ncbi:MULTISPECIES: hypothetical protein [Duncaniella]|uniref:Uncharacterized protein n=1 Tax=Duncaniella dubosii TaxID=2518971 RepID=A0A4V1D3K2_9BACT|nr:MULTISPECIES: hypothetical protein [Duncaniella]MBJ2189261.1 hypothetical protein [Muribaculaceae bacterium]MCX4284537.1 hypothetical protein [Duncaniella dubosii]QCD43298.1 hypothetical protein E7747_14080 [Duncaniella dubosii]HBN63090.1 hypothetical protein [Porphyromonadaceae bacterium]
MEDKKLTPQESMALITKMIEDSKQRIATPDTRVSVMWATLSIVTAVIVGILCLITHDPRYNYIWLAIPIIGYPLNFSMGRKKAKRHEKTYVEYVNDGIWRIVGYITIALTAICLIYDAIGYPQIWIAMFYFAFIVVGFAAAMTGVILKEKSYVFGGIFSIVAGLITAVSPLCGTPLFVSWTIPLYIFCFFMMFIVPAVIIRHKLKKITK